MSTTSIGGPCGTCAARGSGNRYFRRGPARTNRTRSQAIFGNVFFHLLPVKVREKSLRVRATYYLGLDLASAVRPADRDRTPAHVLLPPRRAASLP